MNTLDVLIKCRVTRQLVLLLELLNKVWGLTGCPLEGQPVRKNRSVRFGFGGLTVLLASSGDPVSFNTTVGGGVLLRGVLIFYICY